MINLVQVENCNHLIEALGLINHKTYLSRNVFFLERYKLFCDV